MEKIVGRLTANAEATIVKDQVVINFRIAENRTFRDHAGERKTRTRFFNCKYWTKSDSVTKYLVKGKLVELDGIVSAEAYIKDKGKQTAEAVAVLVLYVIEMQLHGKSDTPQQTPAEGDNVI